MFGIKTIVILCRLGIPVIISAIMCIAQNGDGMGSSVALKNGEYLSEKYVARLRKTQSPFSAFKVNRLQLVGVDQQRDGTHLTPILNFHEGGPEIVIKANGETSVQLDAGMNVSSITAYSMRLGDLILGFGDFIPQRYIYVGNASTYIARVTVAGSYVDGSNQLYEFFEDGRAVFPNRKFSYSMGMDHTFHRFDYF